MILKLYHISMVSFKRSILLLCAVIDQPIRRTMLSRIGNIRVASSQHIAIRRAVSLYVCYLDMQQHSHTAKHT